jgi:hypothetical protein
LEAAQEAALLVLGRLGPAASDAVPTIDQALADPNPGIKLAAIQALGQIGPASRSAIPDLVAIIAQGAMPIRVTAAAALLVIDANCLCEPAVAKAIAGAIPGFLEALASSGNRETEQIGARALSHLGKGANKGPGGQDPLDAG